MVCGETDTESDVVAPLTAQALGLGRQAARETGAPKFEPLIWNCTEPVGMPAPASCGATEAVKVTESPKLEGFLEEETVVVVAAFLMTCEIAAEVLPMKLLSVLE